MITIDESFSNPCLLIIAVLSQYTLVGSGSTDLGKTLLDMEPGLFRSFWKKGRSQAALPFHFTPPVIPLLFDKQVLYHERTILDGENSQERRHAGPGGKADIVAPFQGQGLALS